MIRYHINEVNICKMPTAVPEDDLIIICDLSENYTTPGTKVGFVIRYEIEAAGIMLPRRYHIVTDGIQIISIYPFGGLWYFREVEQCPTPSISTIRRRWNEIMEKAGIGTT